jgi:hypothetical protein
MFVSNINELATRNCTIGDNYARTSTLFKHIYLESKVAFLVKSLSLVHIMCALHYKAIMHGAEVLTYRLISKPSSIILTTFEVLTYRLISKRSSIILTTFGQVIFLVPSAEQKRFRHYVQRFISPSF